MTVELSNVSNLPEELIDYIYEFDKQYIDYINKYDILSWDKIEESIYENIESFDLIERIDEIISKINPSIYIHLNLKNGCIMIILICILEKYGFGMMNVQIIINIMKNCWNFYKHVMN